MEDAHHPSDAASMTDAPPAPPSPHRAPLWPAPMPDAAPLSDLEVAAQYASLEIQSVAAPLADASMASAPPRAAAVASAEADESSDKSGDEAHNEPMADESSADESSSDEEEDAKYSTAKLRAEIEAAMEGGDAQAAGPPTTANEVASLPVREPAVALTADSPIAECGSVLSMSVAGLMMTVKSLPNAKPLDEGSVLCLADRTLLGCIDEVFGPVLLPMYLVRFESADKMPAGAAVNARVFFAPEHTTYIEPEQIKDKGTDASNLYDEENDEAVYSDDEAEAAAKRHNRKRNRGGAPAAAAAAARPSGQQQHPLQGRASYSQGGPNRASGGSVDDYTPGAQSFAYSGGVPFQVQPYGGQTKYTTGPVAFGQPPYAAPMAYGPTKYTSPGGYAPPPSAPTPPAQYSQALMYHHAQHGVTGAPAYQAPPPYHAPYAPPPPPQAPYASGPHHYPPPPQPSTGYSQPVNPPYPQGVGAPPPAPRGPPQGDYAANPGQPPLPRGGYQDRRY